MDRNKDAIVIFMADIQKDILPSLREFGDKLEHVEGISDALFEEYAWIYKRLRWSFEQTADSLQGEE